MVVCNGQARTGGELLLIGITDENIRLLKEGKPILMTPRSHPGTPAGLVITIMYGETEQKIYDELKSQGVLEGAITKRIPSSGHN